MKSIYFICLFLTVLIISACSDSTGNGDSTDKHSLQYFVSSLKELKQDTAFAWAIGGQKNYLEDSTYPYSVIFHQILGSWNFQYFETKSTNDNPEDLKLYFKKEYDVWIMFDGNLRRFRHPGVQNDVWGRVAFRTNSSIYLSKAIRIKGKDKPTLFMDSVVQIDMNNPMEPYFSWLDDRGTPNSIYFEALATDLNYLVSATITRERYFKFYDLANVIYNLRDVLPPPTLSYGFVHNFILIGIDKDNWGYFISERTFLVE